MAENRHNKGLNLDGSLSKPPPQDIILEEFIINRLINDSSSFLIIIQNLEPEDFFKPDHQDMFKIVLDLYNSLGRPINFMDVSSYMIKKGLDYSILLTINSMQTPGHYAIQDNIRVLQDISAHRRLISITHELMHNLWEPNFDWYDACSRAVIDMEMISDKYSKGSSKFSHNVDDTLTKIMEVMNGKKRPGLEMKFNKLKNVLNLTPNNLIFLAASPKAGKTRFLVALIYEIMTNNEDVSVQWFSGEDDKQHIVRLLLSYHTNIPESIMIGEQRMLNGNEYDQLKAASTFITTMDIEIIDEPTDVDKVSMRFGTFCSKRRSKLCILLYDNFNIARDLVVDQSGLEKENYIASSFQRINTMNNKNGKKSVTIVVDHLSKEHIRKASLEEGYRPRQEHLKGSNRKYEVVTQLAMLNRPSLYKDLVGEERSKGYISLNGKLMPREDILNKLLIFELVANRNGSLEEGHTLIHYTADLGTMEYFEWDDNMEVLPAEAIKYEERNITNIDEDTFNKEVWIKFPSGTHEACYIQLKFDLGKTDAVGNVITLDYVLNKYSSFVAAKNELQNGKYTRKDDVIVDLCTFLQKKMYNQKFEKINTKKEDTRDYYLYGIS